MKNRDDYYTTVFNTATLGVTAINWNETRKMNLCYSSNQYSPALKTFWLWQWRQAK